MVGLNQLGQPPPFAPALLTPEPYWAGGHVEGSRCLVVRYTGHVPYATSFPEHLSPSRRQQRPLAADEDLFTSNAWLVPYQSWF